MQRVDYSARERISTQAGAMNLDAGRPALAEAVKLFLFSAAAWVVCCLGLVVVAAVWGGSAYEHRAITLLRYLAGGTGAGLAGLAVFYGGAIAHVFVSEWYGYQARRDAWHRAELRAYSQAGGQLVDRQLTVKALTTQEPAHLLLVTLALAEKIRNGQAREPSLAALQGDIWCGRVKVGELSKPAAEEFLAALGQMGVITGRKKGVAGQLVTTDLAELYTIATTKAGRVRALAAPAEAE